MSFVAQEQALLDLLFDPHLRDDFCKNSVNALAGYDLEETERNDFLCIRPDALALDAAIRIDLILSQMARQYPVTFGVLSSFTGGLECLQNLVDSEFIRTKPLERNIHFGTRLREKITTLKYQTQQEYAFVNAILEAELAMVFTSSHLKQAEIHQLEQDKPNPIPIPIPIAKDGSTLPIRLARHVSAGVIPLPYAQLKQLFCPCEGVPLWRQLNDTPISADQRRTAFKTPQVKLLLARALVSFPSQCEPGIDFSTMELPEGFAPLFQYVNGENSVMDILQQLGKAGAQPAMLDNIHSHFMRLLEEGMLSLERPS